MNKIIGQLQFFGLVAAVYWTCTITQYQLSCRLSSPCEIHRDQLFYLWKKDKKRKMSYVTTTLGKLRKPISERRVANCDRMSLSCTQSSQYVYKCPALSRTRSSITVKDCIMSLADLSHCLTILFWGRQIPIQKDNLGLPRPY